MGAEIVGLNKFLRDMKGAPPELQKELRRRAQEIAEPIAADARGRASTGQQQLVAGSIRAVKDRLPVIKAGGGSKLGSTTPRRRKPSAGDVFFGADFGSNSLPQFQGKKKGGQMVFAAIKGKRKQTADEYLDAVEKVFKGKGF